jgi:hypothetical protein
MGTDPVRLGYVGRGRRKAEVGIAHRGCCNKRQWEERRGRPEGDVAVLTSQVVVNTRDVVIGTLKEAIVEHGRIYSAVRVPE